ncbi:MAG: hypothetical protein QOF41_3142 [Methylobacteriaceae bacterium]|nr:hypothetical protein [Methylobacteriaceae bacterium]
MCNSMQDLSLADKPARGSGWVSTRASPNDCGGGNTQFVAGYHPNNNNSD